MLDVSTINQKQVDHFWSKVDVHQPSGCWEWLGGKNSGGYGRHHANNVTIAAHRLSYQLLIERIPDNVALDHLCRNRSCVNPDHLQPVSIAENVLRGYGACARHARKTHCLHGHEYSPENTHYDRRGHRLCITCELGKGSHLQPNERLLRPKPAPLGHTRIQEIRTSLGMTQPEFAMFIGAHTNSISRWERGDQDPIRERHITKLVELDLNLGRGQKVT